MKEIEGVGPVVVVDGDGSEARVSFCQDMEHLGEELALDGRASSSYYHAGATFTDGDGNQHSFDFAPIWGQDELAE